MLTRFSVIAFQTIISPRRGPAEERGGGVCFVPVEERADWPRSLDQIVREHFHHSLGRSVEVGIASLDADVLATVCHRSGSVYWQGADEK